MGYLAFPLVSWLYAAPPAGFICQHFPDRLLMVYLRGGGGGGVGGGAKLPPPNIIELIESIINLPSIFEGTLGVNVIKFGRKLVSAIYEYFNPFLIFLNMCFS